MSVLKKIKKPAALVGRLNYRILSIVLLLVIIGMLGVWRPWQTRGERTIQITGEAVLKAEPDEFLFYPSYEFSDPDANVAKKKMNDTIKQIVDKLKSIGIPENKIQASSNFNDPKTYYAPEGEKPDPSYYVNFNITVSSKDKAQKVSDYLLASGATGSLSPSPNFSTEKRNQLQDQAREAALQDARRRAEQTASGLGTKLGKVKDVSNGQGFDGNPVPLNADFAVDGDYGVAEPSSGVVSLGILPGESEVRYTVNVTYFMR